MTAIDSPRPPMRRLAIAAIVTIAALALFQFGAMTPLPGVDAALVYGAERGLAGFAAARFSVFALGVTPILSILILLEGARLAIPPFDGWARERRSGYRAVVFVGSLLLAAFQAYGFASAAEGVAGLVVEPGAAFRLTTMATCVGATALLYWAGEAATRYGLCNGFWLLYLAPTIARGSWAVSGVTQLWRDGSLSGGAIATALVFTVAAIALLVATSPSQDEDSFADVWPPLLAELASAVLVALWAAHAGFDSVDMSAGPFRLVALAALIIVFQAMRRDPAAQSPRLWAMSLAQIFTFVGGVVLTKQLGLPVAIGGASLMLTVMLARSGLASIRALQREG